MRNCHSTQPGSRRQRMCSRRLGKAHARIGDTLRHSTRPWKFRGRRSIRCVSQEFRHGGCPRSGSQTTCARLRFLKVPPSVHREGDVSEGDSAWPLCVPRFEGTGAAELLQCSLGAYHDKAPCRALGNEWRRRESKPLTGDPPPVGTRGASPVSLCKRGAHLSGRVHARPFVLVLFWVRRERCTSPAGGSPARGIVDAPRKPSGGEER